MMAESPRTDLPFLASLAQGVATKPKCTIAVERREKRFESGRCGARRLQRPAKSPLAAWQNHRNLLREGQSCTSC